MNGSAPTFVLIAEDTAHRQLAIVLTDRVVLARCEWLADFADPGREDLVDPALRGWQDFAGTEGGYVKWTRISELCRQHGVPRRHGLGLGLLRRNAEMGLRLMKLRRPLPSAVVLLCDADKHGAAALLESLNEGRRGDWPFQVAIGVCEPEAEAWYLNGYVPGSAEEERRLRELTQELGINPCARAEQLSSGRDQHKRSAKRVLGYLVEAEPAVAAAHQRARHGIRNTDMEKLRQRGSGTGLAAFLMELEERLAPCFGPLAPTAP